MVETPVEHLTTHAMQRVAADYPPPRHNVLLLSCMDLRLTDELAAFMDRDNLTNRYDHLVIAGAALGVLQTDFSSWREIFFDHLRIAIELHEPHDVYIVEHRACGAYKKFLDEEYDDSAAAQKKERESHLRQATKLKKVIEEWCKDESERTKSEVHLGVYGFLMDLRGDVELLFKPDDKQKGKKKAGK